MKAARWLASVRPSFDFAYTSLHLLGSTTVIMLPCIPTYGGTCLFIDSHIQHFILATEEITVTQQVSYRPIKCQSRSWSSRVTTVNGLHKRWKPATQTNRDSTRDKIYARYNQRGTSETYRCQNDVFVWVQSTVCTVGVLQVFQNRKYKLQRRLSDVLSNQQNRQKYV